MYLAMQSKPVYRTAPWLSVLLFVQFSYPYVESARNELSLINQCTCLGFSLAYECTIVAEGGATIWKGSAIDCSNEIFLSHSLMEFTKMSTGCNHRPITAYGIGIEDNRYISRLDIGNLNRSMINESVQCTYSNGTSTVVGTDYIEITTDPIPPPNDTTISRIVEDVEGNFSLTFVWSPVIFNCPSLYYTITSNCGWCPNTTTRTTATCRGVPVSVGDRCVFTIQSVVCGDVVGNNSSIFVDLKVPDAPVISAVPTYSYATGNLSAITIIFSELEKFNITNGLDGSATDYTIVYSDPASGMICYSTTLPASAVCDPHSGVCKHVQNLPLSNYCSQPTGIRMSAYGTNVVKRGSMSNSITIGIRNTFVEVTFEENFYTATCKFLEWQPPTDERYRSNCSIIYGYSSRFPISSKSASGLSLSDTVVLDLSVASEVQFKHCQEYQFMVTASNGSFTVRVMGTFITGDSLTSSFSAISGLTFGVSVGVLIAIILVITIISVTVIAVLVRRNTATSHQSESVDKISSSHTIDTDRNPAYEVVRLQTRNY